MAKIMSVKNREEFKQYIYSGELKSSVGQKRYNILRNKELFIKGKCKDNSVSVGDFIKILKKMV